VDVVDGLVFILMWVGLDRVTHFSYILGLIGSNRLRYGLGQVVYIDTSQILHWSMVLMLRRYWRILEMYRLLT